MNLSVLLRPLTVMMLLVGTLFSIYTAWHWGLANLYFKNADYYLKHWQQQGAMDVQYYPTALRAIDKAIQLHPQHPHYRNVRAKINQWGAFAGVADSHELLLDVRADLLLASRMRPDWPVTWIDLAQVELDLNRGEFTEAVAGYLAEANATGAFLEEVLLTEHALLIRSWTQLSLSQRQHYVRKLTAMSRKGSLLQAAFAQAGQAGQLTVLCSQIRVQAELRRVRTSADYRRHCTG